MYFLANRRCQELFSSNQKHNSQTLQKCASFFLRPFDSRNLEKISTLSIAYKLCLSAWLLCMLRTQVVADLWQKIEIGQVACQFLDRFRNRLFEHIKYIKTPENRVNVKEEYIYKKNINLFLLKCTLI